MRILLTVLVLFIFIAPAFPGTSATLPGLLKPFEIVCDSRQIYIAEESCVTIFALDSFKLIKKFGQEGEGPREFKKWIFFIDLQSDSLLVQSSGRLSFFKKDGSFIKQFTIIPTGLYFKPLNKNFVNLKFSGDKNRLFYLFNLYDNEQRLVKNILRFKSPNQKAKDYNPISGSRLPIFYTYKDKVFIENQEQNGTIMVFNRNGEQLFVIDQKISQVNVSAFRENKYKVFFKSQSAASQSFSSTTRKYNYPDYFPLTRFFHVADDKIYILTFKEENQNRELLVFDLEGKLLQKKMLPIREKNVFELYPYTITQGKVYQIIENEESEEWELFCWKLEI
ncbi:MAG: hypothetical protein GY757_33250 [bacterium]|nr:hypothetical protein [bacterium]